MPPFPAYFDSCGVETLKKEESDQLEIEHVPLSLTGNEVENPQVGMQAQWTLFCALTQHGIEVCELVMQK